MTEARPRVLIVSHDYAEAGLRRQLNAFARWFDVRFITPHRSTALVFSDHRAVGDSLTRIYPRLTLFGHQYWLRSATIGIREFRPDLVYITYDPWSAIFLQAVTASAVWAPQALVVSGAKKNTYRAYPGLRGRAKAALARLGISRTDHVIAASEMTAALFRRVHGVAADNISVVTRVGVDTGIFHPPGRTQRDRPLVVGYCGRLTEHKGVTDLVDAVESVRDRGTEVEIELLGAGDLRDSLASRASDPWLRVHDAVPSDDVAGFLRGLDVFVLPARVLEDHEEHDAHALLQALASGLPAIGTESGIIPEILDDPDDVIVPPGDSDALAAAIAELADQPDRRERLAVRGRRAAEERYSFERVAERYAEVFGSLLDRRMLPARAVQRSSAPGVR